MRRSLFIAILTLLSSGKMFCQTDSALVRMRDFVKNISVFNRILPQEKVYLHLDNTGYFQGERIWFKAYAIRSDRNRLGSVSKVLYVELLNPFGEIEVTQKVKLENGQGHGDFALDSLRTTGFYEIRAYTRYNTNFDSTGIFSRVIPIYRKPATDGDFSKQEIDEVYNVYRSASATDTLSAYKTRKFRKAQPLDVAFYPEGGHLVRGLTTKVAFSVNLADSTSLDSCTGTLCDISGTPICEVKTTREGRGTFVCTPGEKPLCLKIEYNGKENLYPLPDIEESGVAMTVRTDEEKVVRIHIHATPDLRQQRLGLTLINGGDVIKFENFRITASGHAISFRRDDIPRGVSQLTLFDSDGRIWAQRLFFIAPTSGDNSTIGVSTTLSDSTVAQTGEMTLTVESAPQTTISVAVRDAMTTTNDHRANAATWLLLSSDLKGFVRNAEYYFESDDAAHREAADLLCLVQGWTRYDWKMMSGNAPFVKKQPVEDQLYLDGRLVPRNDMNGAFWVSGKEKKRRKDVADVQLSVNLFSRTGEINKGKTQTDEQGYFAFAVPDIKGKWTTIMHSMKDEKDTPYLITIDRWFHPIPRSYDPDEKVLTAALLQSDVSVKYVTFSEKTTSALEESLKKGGKAESAGRAIVKAKRRYDWRNASRRDWQVTRKRAAKRSQFHFDMQAEADNYLDQGKEPPSFISWLLSKPIFHEEIYKNKRALGIVAGESQCATYMRHVTDIEDRDNLGVNDETDENNERIDYYEDAYISLEHNIYTYICPQSASDYVTVSNHDPIHAFIYPLIMHKVVKKGWRQTSFLGYNSPTTFVQPNYSELPPEEDHRRTLYWNPDLTTDENGTATIGFIPTPGCRAVFISTEGIATDGRPIVKAE